MNTSAIGTLRRQHKIRKTGLIIGFALAIAALVPVAVAAFGIARGGVEAYMVLAAVMLG